MVMTDNGINLIRDLLIGSSSANLTHGGLGTDNTAPSSQNTGLNINTNLGTTGTIKAIVYTATDRQILFDYNLVSTEGNGNTFKEWGLNNGTILFNRQTFYDLAKDSTKEFAISIVIRIVPE